MSTTLRKIMAITLTLALVFSLSATAFSTSAQTTDNVSEIAQEVYTSCNGACDYCPSIVIPGIFQSQSRMYDDDGNMITNSDGKPLTQLMVNVSKNDIVRYVLKAIVPLLSSLLIQADVGLSNTVADIVADVLKNNAKDSNGKHIENIDVIKYPQSVARCTEEGKKYIYDTIPLEGYTKIAGEDHLYFFTYDSFGSVLDIADELYAFIQQVKDETGHDKVNLVPISQGGSIANALFEYHKEIKDDLNRVVYIIPALDGSMLVGEISAGNFIKDDDMLYSDLFPLLMEEDQQSLAYTVNLLLRLLPKNTAYSIIDKTVNALFETVIKNCTSLWALIPSAYYEELAEKYLSGDENAFIRNETRKFYVAQCNSDKNILELKANGVQVFDVIDYDFKLYPLFPGWDDVNGDGVIHLDSTSAGATSAPVGESLPSGYIQQGTYCNCGGNHISPDKTVDASTGILCETSFYFKGQDHEGSGRNDVIMKLAVELLTDRNFTSVHSYPDAYPQFNVGRESKHLIKGLIPDAKSVDTSKLSAEDKAELEAAIAEAEAVAAQTNVDYDAFTSAQTRLTNILVKIGVRSPEVIDAEELEKAAKMKKISDWVYKYIGPRGYSDVLRFKHTSW